MAKRTLALETPQKVGEQVFLKGWVRTVRSHGKLIFVDLRDRSGVVQIIFNPQISAKAYQEALKLKPEFAFQAEGVVKKRSPQTINPTLPSGEVEIEATKIKILATSEPLPFDLGSNSLNVSLPTLLDFRPLTLRHPKMAAIFKLQEVIVQSFRKTLKDLDFTEVQLPTIAPTITEGGAEVFHLDYYDYDAYLAQSPQLYKQIMVGVFERVFSVAHAYRAEPSVTTRHLSEYLGLDAEIGFIENFEEIMEVLEKVIQDIFINIKKECAETLAIYKATVPNVANRIPQLKLREAQEVIFKRTNRDHRAEPDLEPEDEREICKWSEEEKGSELVLITHYPTKKRPFYAFPDPEDPNYTLSFDLLGRGVEWVTGGQRINDYEKLLENIKKWGNEPENFKAYLQAFKYGMPPEGGFCMGLERVTTHILGLKNIREAALFPRDMERIDQSLSKHQ